jgi:gliding motility-associated-like protein
MKRFFSFLVLFLCSIPVLQAKHITGGEMIYDLISSTATTKTYRITLILFRDENCFNCADMPPVVRIGIYNNDNNEPYGGSGTLPTIDVNLNRVETLPLINVPLCISNQPALNYTAGYYPFVVTLNNNNLGYTAAYQTCCRIDNINNIDNGTNGAGATYTSVIPGNSSLGTTLTDNSPRFEKAISVVCFNKEFTLDFSATDPDGDQLVYSMCNAYNGGAAQNAQNITPSIPPYGSLNYVGGFSGNQPLGPQASINPQTGIISGIAPNSGKYVVSVCVSSFRNGRLIAVHRKDMIITVADCDFASAELLPDYITCDGFSFQFSNRNQSPLNQSFFWDFGDPGSGANNTSTNPNPTHTFSTAGLFTVKFVVNRGTPCADSTTTRVAVFPGFFPAQSNNSPACKGNPVLFTDQTTANYGAPNYWHWDFGLSGTSSDTSIVQNPQFTYSQSGTYTVTLVVGSDRGCRDTIQGTVTVVDKPVLQVTNDTLICSVDPLQLSASTGGNGNYSWSPNYNISNTSVQNPVVTPIRDTIYFVTYVDASGCTNRDSVRVRVVDTVTLNAAGDTTICRTDGVTLALNSNALRYQWTPATTLNNPTLKNPIATPNASITTYQVRGFIGSCYEDDSIRVRTIPYPIARAGRDTLICWGTSAFLQASGGVGYTWTPAVYLNNTSIANPIVQSATADFIDYVVAVTDTLGCPKPSFDTVRVDIDRVIANAGPRDTSVVSGQPLQLQATGSTIFQWSPATWLSSTTVSNPVSTPEDDIEYIVQVSNRIGCTDVDSIRVRYYRVSPDFFVPNAFTPNGDGLNDVVTPLALGMKSVDLFMVYNRWGQLMFRTTQIEEGWNGKYRGVVQPVGAYVWYAEGTDYTNKKLTRKGTVLLLQ